MASSATVSSSDHAGLGLAARAGALPVSVRYCAYPKCSCSSGARNGGVITAHVRQFANVISAMATANGTRGERPSAALASRRTPV